MLAAGRTANPLKPARLDDIFPAAGNDNFVDPDVGGRVSKMVGRFPLDARPYPKTNLDSAVYPRIANTLSLK